MPETQSVACGLDVRPHERTVVINGREVLLTHREFEVLARLAEHPGWVLSANQLSEDDDGDAYSPESVSVHVARIRHKLAGVEAPDMVETVRGCGYRLRVSRPVELPAGDGGARRSADRALRDAAWQLHEAVFEAEHLGTPRQLMEVADELERVRRAVYAVLAE
ncbi:MAG: winged helix-turn-helix transcriptional regulator [Actinobacteria bacterium]|nr:MAG: winged helix-turn-helix transcriptional regulator [Actinomycetota bacterium]